MMYVRGESTASDVAITNLKHLPFDTNGGEREREREREGESTI